MEKRVSYFKSVVAFLLVYYISNILVYFIWLRPRILEGGYKYLMKVNYNSWSDQQAAVEKFKQLVLPDWDMFNPIFNVAYSFGHSYLHIVSALVGIFSVYIFYSKKILVVRLVESEEDVQPVKNDVKLSEWDLLSGSKLDYAYDVIASISNDERFLNSGVSGIAYNLPIPKDEVRKCVLFVSDVWSFRTQKTDFLDEKYINALSMFSLSFNGKYSDIDVEEMIKDIVTPNDRIVSDYNQYLEDYIVGEGLNLISWRSRDHFIYRSITSFFKRDYNDTFFVEPHANLKLAREKFGDHALITKLWNLIEVERARYVYDNISKKDGQMLLNENTGEAFSIDTLSESTEIKELIARIQSQRKF